VGCQGGGVKEFVKFHEVIAMLLKEEYNMFEPLK
jgi:hypothetical protein